MSGQLRDDPAQLEVIRQLQELYDACKEYVPPFRKIIYEPPLSVGNDDDQKKTVKKETKPSHVKVNMGFDREHALCIRPDFSIFGDENYEPSVAPKGIYLHGEVGTGKTMLMNIFYSSLTSIERKRRVHFNYFMSYVYSEMHALRVSRVRRLREAAKKEDYKEDIYFHKKGDDDIRELAVKIVNESWLLCFDEMQVSDIATASILNTLFEHLYDLGAVIVLTSNRPPDQLYLGNFQKDRLNIFVQLLLSNSKVFFIDSKIDYRSLMFSEKTENNRTLSSSGTYFHPLTTETKASLNTQVQHLIDTRHASEKDLREIKVYGRKISPDFVHGRLARFQFKNLCAKEYGPSDYLALCSKYHTIVVDSIPVLGIKQKDEARRFITLIDAMYESRVKFLCSASDIPEKLFLLKRSDSDEESDGLASAKAVKKRTEELTTEDQMLLEMMGELGYDMKQRFHVSTIAIFTGEEEWFSFKRAVSRMKEMQTEQYLELPHNPTVVDFVQSAEAKHSSADQPRHQPFSDDFSDEVSYRETIYTERAAEKQKQLPKFKANHFWGLQNSWSEVTTTARKRIRELIRERKEPDK
eukprot:Nk52_evm8s161 gene=Nk52_evmTU8s161